MASSFAQAGSYELIGVEVKEGGGPVLAVENHHGRPMTGMVARVVGYEGFAKKAVVHCYLDSYINHDRALAPKASHACRLLSTGGRQLRYVVEYVGVVFEDGRQDGDAQGVAMLKARRARLKTELEKYRNEAGMIEREGLAAIRERMKSLGEAHQKEAAEARGERDAEVMVARLVHHWFGKQLEQDGGSCAAEGCAQRVAAYVQGGLKLWGSHALRGMDEIGQQQTGRQ